MIVQRFWIEHKQNNHQNLSWQDVSLCHVIKVRGMYYPSIGRRLQKSLLDVPWRSLSELQPIATYRSLMITEKYQGWTSYLTIFAGIFIVS
jgi:hypothetical protein